MHTNLRFTIRKQTSISAPAGFSWSWAGFAHWLRNQITFPHYPRATRKKHQYSTSRFGAAHSCLLERILYAKNIHTWLYSERAAFTNTSQTCSPNALQRVPLRFLSSFLFSVFCFSPWSCVCGFSPQIAFGIGSTYKALSVPLTKYREFTYKNICPASLLGTKCTKWQSLLATPECIFMHFVETP